MKNIPEDLSDKPEQNQKIYSYLDFIQFEPKNKISSIGKMPVSTVKSNPQFSIGTSERKSILKQFVNNELAKVNLIGKESQGPNYNITDKYMYERDPTHKIGTGQRKALNNNEVYDYFNKQDIDFNPVDANNYRKPQAAISKIGLENRFKNGAKLSRGTPGPQYNPSMESKVKASSKYSFGYRRDVEGMSCIKPLISTPNVVGPGSYLIQEKVNHSLIEIEPQYSFPKQIRKQIRYEDYTLNQTYAHQNSVGTQCNSRKKSMPKISIGKGQRDDKLGYFPQTMAMQPQKISISMPNF